MKSRRINALPDQNTIDWKNIENEFSLKNIVWKFNPPAAPWWSGFWERLVRMLKELLRRS